MYYEFYKDVYEEFYPEMYKWLYKEVYLSCLSSLSTKQGYNFKTLEDTQLSLVQNSLQV